MANARDYQASGEYGLALAELDQAVAAAPNSPIAENVRTQVRAAATAQVREASRLAAEATRTAAIKLELRPGWSWYQSSRPYVTLEGQVRNISPQSLRSVEAVVIYYTADGTFLTSNSSLIEYRPLLPGQTSPFKVISPYNPAMSTASVEFKELLGGKIEHREAGG